MLNLLIEIFICGIICFLFLFGVSKKLDKDEYISKYTTTCLKGIAIIIVCLQYFSQKVGGSGIIFLFSKIGYLGVSIFLFLSGYGLSKSLQKNGMNNNTFLKRIKGVYLPFLIINILSIILYSILLKTNYNFSNIIYYSLGIKLIDDVMWYVITIIIFYIVFYILFKYIAAKKACYYLLLFSILYLVLCLILDVRSCWYNSSLCFFIGVSTVFYKSKFDQIFKNKNILYLFIFGVMFCISSFMSYIFTSFHILNVLFLYLSSIFFIFSIIQVLYLFKVGNKTTYFIGIVSYEIYLTHMKLYNIVFKDITNVSTIIIFILSSLLIGYLFHKIFIIFKLKKA